MYKQLLIFFFIVPGWGFSQDFDSENVLLALTKAYPYAIKLLPGKMNERPYSAIEVYGRKFYWVEGRILPEEDLENWKSYMPNDFYYYAKEVRDPLTLSAEERATIEKRATIIRSKQKRLYINSELWNTLHQSRSYQEAISRTKEGRFFRRLVVVHESIWKPLKQVEAELTELAKKDSSLHKFLTQDLNTVYSFFYRKIAKTTVRSTHSYGIGVDVLDRRNKKASYWLWRRVASPKWLSEPLASRWNPHPKVIETFEKYGFIWGGKWTFYDTIHFEYRPDILILNGYPVTLVARDSQEET